MLYHNLLLFLRGIKRDKTSFYINQVGLSTGLACALMICLWVDDEWSMDKFHVNDRRIFQVMHNMPFSDGIHTTAATPGILADALTDELPEIEEAVVEYPGRGSKGIISFSETRVNASEMYVSSNYFNVFSYSLLHGSKGPVLTDRYTVLVSDDLAMRLFNSTENAIGKRISWDQGNLTDLNGEYIVSGVFERPGKHSSKHFDLLFSYDLLFEKYGSFLGLKDWRSSDPDTYVLLKEEADIAQVNVKVRDFIRTKFSSGYGDKDLASIGTLFLQRYSSTYLHNRYENGTPAGGRIFYVRLFSILAGFILIVACINFMNLTTAKASRRAKESGIKRTLGSDRKAIALQFFAESVSMAFLALPVAVVLVEMILPQFNAITGKQLGINLSPHAVVVVFLVTLITGLFSGSYPALYLSSFRPVDALRGKAGSGKGALWLRTKLVVFQFSISIILIVAVLVVYRQVTFIYSKDLGYKKDNVIRFLNKGNILAGGLETFMAEMKRLPGVINVSTYQSDIITGDKRLAETDAHWEGKAPGDMTNFTYVRLRVGHDFIETMGMMLVEGRSFSRAFASDENSIIVNEAAIESMQLRDPVGKTIRVRGEEKIIIGVVRNFHFESFYEQLKPCFLVLLPDGDQIVASISAGNEIETLERIGEFYRTFNHGLPFEFTFLDEDYRALYASEQNVAELSKYFAGVAITLSCLGLFGLAIFMAEQRTKEIGIRKVLGASTPGIVALLCKDFIRLVLIAILIASPVAWWIAGTWLEDFAYRISIEWWMFAITALAATAIALLTVGAQAIKAAIANPVNALRSE